MKKLLLLAALLAASLPGVCHAENVLGTAIASLPLTITKPGAYHFTKDLVFTGSTGNAITINSSSVELDLNGHQLVCSSGTNNSAVGIYCSGFSRVVVRDGIVRTFQNGIVLNAHIASVTDIVASSNYTSGITLAGNNNEARRNRVLNTGGSPTAPFAVGLSLTGTYGVIADNDIQNTSEVDATSRSCYGIRLKGCSNFVLTGNHVLDVEPFGATKAKCAGISVQTSDTIVILGNVVTMADTGFDLAGGTSGKYGENTTSGASNAFFVTGSGMVDIGSNN